MKTILYLGLDVPPDLALKGKIIHYPIIRILPIPKENLEIQSAFTAFDQYTHLIFTSKTAVSIFFDYAPYFGINIDNIRQKSLVAVGQKTAGKIYQYCSKTPIIAAQETAEGIIDIFEGQDLKTAYFFWPRSALSRPIISDWLQSKNIKYCACIFYQTVNHSPLPLPDITQFDEIIFTSPSTIDAFISTFGTLPKNKILTCIGPITQAHLARSLTLLMASF